MRLCHLMMHYKKALRNYNYEDERKKSMSMLINVKYRQ